MSNRTSLGGSGGTPVIPPTVAQQYTTDFLTAIPSAGNLNVLGWGVGPVVITQTQASGDTVSIENRAWTTQYIVDSSALPGSRGTFQTIQAAITAAVAPATVFIRAGTYTEDLVLKAGVGLAGFCAQTALSNIPGGTTKIIGNHSFSSSDINADKVIFQDLSFFGTVGGAGLLTLSGTAAKVSFNNCQVDGNNTVGITTSAGCGIDFNNCNLTGRGDGLFASISGSLKLYNCYVNAGFGVAVFNSSSAIEINGCIYRSSISTGAAGSVEIRNSEFGLPGGTSTCSIVSGFSIYNSSLFGNLNITTGASAVVQNCCLRASSSISGAGTLNYSNISFASNLGNAITVTNQLPIWISNNSVVVRSPLAAAFPYTLLPQDAVVCVDTSAARTVNMPATATTAIGQTFTVKDVTGTAATNNITIASASGNIDGAASTIINTNYGSKKIIRNTSTTWAVI